MVHVLWLLYLSERFIHKRLQQHAFTSTTIAFSKFFRIDGCVTMPLIINSRLILGGWLLVSDVVVGSSSRRFNFPVETSYQGVSNSQKVLSKTAMNQLRTHLSFTQLRFFCRKQRTFHVMTTLNSAGEAVVQYFSGQTNTMPASCGSYVKMDDDNSVLAGVCSRWGWDGSYNVGKWGHKRDQTRLYDHPAFTKGYIFWIAPDSSRWECDDQYAGVTSGNVWKIFVR